MPEDGKQEDDEVTPEELDEQDAEQLPDREAMSVISADFGRVPLEPLDPNPTLPVEPPDVA
jgi:hypothetical protein